MRLAASMPETELESLYTTLWFDPGGTTGWALFSIYDGVMGPPPFEAWLGTASKDSPTVRNEEAQLAWKAEVAEAGRYKILDNVAFWSAGQFVGDSDAQVDEMVELTMAWPPESPIGCEGFTLRQFRMDSMLLEPVRITERYAHAVRDLGPTGANWRRGAGRKRLVIQQPPALAMTMVTDERLRRVNDGAYFACTAGRPHARDAVRHALTFLRREKEARFLGKTLHVC